MKPDDVPASLLAAALSVVLGRQPGSASSSGWGWSPCRQFLVFVDAASRRLLSLLFLFMWLFNHAALLCCYHIQVCPRLPVIRSLFHSPLVASVLFRQLHVDANWVQPLLDLHVRNVDLLLALGTLQALAEWLFILYLVLTYLWRALLRPLITLVLFSFFVALVYQCAKFFSNVYRDSLGEGLGETLDSFFEIADGIAVHFGRLVLNWSDASFGVATLLLQSVGRFLFEQTPPARSYAVPSIGPEEL
eukprot:GHVT01075948.1.p1 GENE.GHVT01075948.1~~GHVT01075948.1.p1  ORF type:complete len:285 (+),score=82.11 GHVT01075948.1:116-856(+)